MSEHEHQPDNRLANAEPIVVEAAIHAKRNEALQRDGPRIYVASLSAYNAGILHGRWIDANQEAASIEAMANEMLGQSPTTRRYGQVDEEWAIHDYEGFGDIRLSESTAFDVVARLADGISRFGHAFAAFAALDSWDAEDIIEFFEDQFAGEWESVEAYAESMLEDMGAVVELERIPTWLRPFVTLDVEGLARDLVLGGDITTTPSESGGVWIFRTA